MHRVKIGEILLISEYKTASLYLPLYWTVDGAFLRMRAAYCKYLLLRILPVNTSIPQIDFLVKTYQHYLSLPFGVAKYFEISMEGHSARLYNDLSVTVS
jgi:hypothetical protein